MTIHKCNRGWVCSEHDNQPAGHYTVFRVACEARPELCDDIDCEESLYNKNVCIHHWQIGTTSGKLVKGVCSICDEERLFINNFGKVAK